MGLLSFDSKPRTVSKGLLKPAVLNKFGEQKKPVEGGGGGWTPSWHVRNYGDVRTAKTVTPSGREVTIERDGSVATVEFWRHHSGATRPAEAQNLRDVARVFGDVLKAVQNYAKTSRPKTIRFSSGSDELDRLYSKAAPQMAKGLGGTYRGKEYGYYTIDLPD